MGMFSLKPDFSASDAALAFCHKGLDFHRAGGWAQLSCQLSLGLGGCPATAGGPMVVRDAGPLVMNAFFLLQLW